MAASSQAAGTQKDGRLNDLSPAPQRRQSDLKATLQQMEQGLRSHSPLEDLGPLFGPEAQGRQA